MIKAGEDRPPAANGAPQRRDLSVRMRMFAFEKFGGLDRDGFGVAIRASLAADGDLAFEEIERAENRRVVMPPRAKQFEIGEPVTVEKARHRSARFTWSGTERQEKRIANIFRRFGREQTRATDGGDAESRRRHTRGGARNRRQRRIPARTPTGAGRELPPTRTVSPRQEYA
jgi:hypothetical protein